jgi:hypothetical protein
MKPRLLACPECDSTIATSRANRKYRIRCQTCGIWLSPSLLYVSVIRSVRVLLAGVISYGLGLRGAALVASAFLIPLPLDWIGIEDLSFGPRIVFSGLSAYLVGLREIRWVAGALLMSLPLGVFFRFLEHLIPPGRLRVLDLPRCPSCSRAIDYEWFEAQEDVCPHCRQGIKQSNGNQAGLHQNLLQTAITTVMLWGVLHYDKSLWYAAVIFCVLLALDLSTAGPRAPRLAISSKNSLTLRLE